MRVGTELPQELGREKPLVYWEPGSTLGPHPQITNYSIGCLCCGYVPILMLWFSSTISLLFYLLFLLLRLLRQGFFYRRKTVCSRTLPVSRGLSHKKCFWAVRLMLFFGVVVGKGEKWNQKRTKKLAEHSVHKVPWAEKTLWMTDSGWNRSGKK